MKTNNNNTGRSMEEVFLTINGKDEQAFLSSYNHDYKSVSEIGLDWAALVEIHDYYKGIVKNKLEIAAQELFLVFKTIQGTHSVKYRIKDPEHLIDKIIRKKIEDGREVTIENFMDEFDDFIGLRILHLFKTDWEPIYKYIKENYPSKETPVAYHREGDDPAFINKCKELGLDTIEKNAGYRSIHYIAKFPFFGKEFKCEIQIRTLFEEAWSEIDHLVRYPYNTENELLNNYLLILNRLAGCADDMGVFLMSMKRNLEQLQSERNDLETVSTELRKEISSLKLKNSKQKRRIDDLMKKLDEGVTAGWPDMSAYQLLSTNDYISRIQNPSGSSIYDYYTRMKEISDLSGINSDDSLKSIFPSASLVPNITGITLPHPTITDLDNQIYDHIQLLKTNGEKKKKE